MKNKLYIAIEGMDYSGKSTVVNAIKDALPEEVILTHEPGVEGLSGMIRDIVVSDECPINARLPLFIASRIDTLGTAFATLEDGMVLLSDRCFLSSAVMQAKNLGGSELSPSGIIDLHSTLKVPFPAAIIYLDITKEEMEIRHKLEGDRDDLDRFAIDNYETIHDNYDVALKYLESQTTTKVHHLSATNSVTSIVGYVDSLIEQILAENAV